MMEEGASNASGIELENSVHYTSHTSVCDIPLAFYSRRSLHTRSRSLSSIHPSIHPSLRPSFLPSFILQTAGKATLYRFPPTSIICVCVCVCVCAREAKMRCKEGTRKGRRRRKKRRKTHCESPKWKRIDPSGCR